jgi:hypothetical protein
MDNHHFCYITNWGGGGEVTLNIFNFSQFNRVLINLVIPWWVVAKFEDLDVSSMLP